MTKRKKIVLVVSLSVLSAVVTYFVGGLVATRVAIDTLLDVRGSTEDSLNTLEYQIQKNRSDFPALANRELISFKCNKETLQGYFYEVSNPKGVVITAHGVNTLADAHGQLQNYFVNNSYDVFSFDMTGCGRSSGKGMKTLHESRFCVRDAVKTVQNLDKTKDLPIFLVGHSWGGYGVVAATEDVKGVSAVVAFSGFNQSGDIMYGFVASQLPVAAVTKPALDTSLSLYYGNYEWFKASTAVKHNPDVKYMIVQGDKDNVVPLKRFSSYANIDENKNPNVTKVLLKDVGHSGPWREKTSIDYSDDLSNKLSDLRRKYNDDIPEDVKQEFLSSIDKEKSSVLNLDLMNQINDLFLSTIK